MFENVPRQKLFSIIQSTAQGYARIYDFVTISSAFGGGAGSTAVWGPVVPNASGGPVTFFVQVASVNSLSSAYAFDILGVYKSFDNTNWFVHTVFTGANHPNLSTVSSTKQNWSYHINNMPNMYHRIQYVFRALRDSTSIAVRPYIKVRGFSEVVDQL